MCWEHYPSEDIDKAECHRRSHGGHLLARLVVVLAGVLEEVDADNVLQLANCPVDLGAKAAQAHAEHDGQEEGDGSDDPLPRC